MTSYVIERKEGPTGKWKVKKEVATKKTTFVDKSAKPGRQYFYRMTAVSKENLRSLPTLEVEIRL